ncbi:Hypothetical protein NTJ_12146 [Nesidiocoris tenuis]|uniref:Uncharacterized protein n=1 Tax=Nesidiocoris tenuis TaxID=355587 RepID=A0ABN7B6U4_9HEMI|nr:Hypothetical protein NTJ_12146 [Nesidiocoris tenuis]
MVMMHELYTALVPHGLSETSWAGSSRSAKKVIKLLMLKKSLSRLARSHQTGCWKKPSSRSCSKVINQVR